MQHHPKVIHQLLIINLDYHISRDVSNQHHSKMPRVCPWSRGSMLDYRSLPPMFKSRYGYIWRLFHLWLRYITFEGPSAHLAYCISVCTKVAVKHQSSSSSSKMPRVPACCTTAAAFTICGPLRGQLGDGEIKLKANSPVPGWMH